MKKNKFIFLIIFIITVCFFNQTNISEAADPTIQMSRVSTSQTDTKWDWGFNIVTTDTPDDTPVDMYIYKGAINENLITSSTITKITSNHANFHTGKILEDGAKYSIQINVKSLKPTVAVFSGIAKTDDNGSVININPENDTGSVSGGGDGGVYTLLAPIGDLKEAPKNMGDYFNTIFKIAIGLCGALAVIMIVIGGVQYMGNESIFGQTEAKSKITAAILGLIIALGSYALLNTINPALLGKDGVNIKQVSAEIIDLPDAGDGTIDPDFAKKDYKYSTDASVSAGVTTAVSKLKEGWEISSFRVYPNERMGIILKKGSVYDSTNVIDVRSGINGFSEVGKGVSKDRKTPKGTWKILSVKTSANGAPVYNKEGSNMGASFWLLSPTTNGERGIGMHGNKNGTLSRTYGCVRLKNSDILALLPYVHSGIPVIINN